MDVHQTAKVNSSCHQDLLMALGQAKTNSDILSFFLNSQIAHFKIPRYVVFVKDYPLTVSGKVSKSAPVLVYSTRLSKTYPYLSIFNSKI